MLLPQTSIRSGWLPRPLGWVLIAGGVAYVLSAIVDSVFSNADLISQLLTVPATVGELWIMGYLIIVGVHSRRTEEVS